MKHFLLPVIALISLIACNNNNDSNSSENKIKPDGTGTVRIDTFTGKDINVNFDAPPDIMLDTIIIAANKHHREINIVMPVISAKEHPWLNRELKELREKTLREFIVSTNDYIRDTVENGIYDGEYMYIEPQNLYKTDSLISFILEAGIGQSTSAFYFVTFNYDNRTKKRILFGDYFKLDSPEDSAVLAAGLVKMLDSEEELCKRLISDPGIVFGFDADNIYFCFERYHMIYWGIRSVKKKYLRKYIRQAYL